MVVKGINLELSKKEMAELASKLKQENIELKQQLAAAKQLNEMYKSALAAEGKFDVKNEEFIVSEKSQINKIKNSVMNITQYISFNDYKANINLDGFDADKPSREVLKCFLIAMGVSPDTIYQSVGNCSYDLLYEKDGIKYAVECKDRRFESTKYSDHCIEAVKLSALINRKKKDEFQKIWLASVFTDGVLVITKDIDQKENIKEAKSLYCPKTTTLSDHSTVTKHLIFYNQQFKYYFCLAVTDTGEIIPHFDKEPINITQLNANLQYKVSEITEPGKLF